MSLGWDIFSFATQIAFLAMQGSMVVFLLRRGRTEKSFRQGFFILFITVTVADCAFVVLGQLTGYFEAYNTFNISLQHVVNIIVNYQPLAHAIIALNRFTAFAFPMSHASMWSRRTVFIAVVAAATVALVLTGVPSIYFGVMYACCIPTVQKVVFSHWYTYATVTTSTFTAMNFGLCCIASFVLNIGTITMLVVHQNSEGSHQSQRRQDVRLLVHSLFMFIVQIFMAFQTFVETTDLNGLLRVYYDLIHEELYGIPRWLQLSSKLWLAGDAKCDVDWLKVKPGVGPKYCGTLYMVLTGQQVLVGDITFKALINNLFALSGAAFLLVVSGTVRKAYTLFYFGRLQKKNVQVIQVTSRSERSTRLTTA